MYEVEIKSYDHKGRGIARINEKIVFVEDALIGEKVNVEIIKDNKKYMEAKVIKRLETSKDRCNSNCIYYDKCGGCNISSISYENQLKFKKEKVIDIFNKYLNMIINPDIIKTSEYNYRNKIVLHVIDGKIGYYEKNTNKLVEIDKCLLATESINTIIKLIKDNLDLKEVSKIMIRNTYKETMVAFDGTINIDKLIKVLDIVDSIYVNDKLVKGKDRIIEKLGDYLFYISKDSFFQVNTKQAYNLYNQVLEFANLNEKDIVLDLYCGTGTIGIFLSKYCKKVIGIEINKSAVEDANNNKKLNNINNIAFINDTASIISKIDNKANVVILDPPRSGLDKLTTNTLIENRVDKIVYVSCDPMTLARDIKNLSFVYELKDIKLFDMFAQDYHVETVVLLELIK